MKSFINSIYKKNYRGEYVPVIGGILLMVVFIFIFGGLKSLGIWSFDQIAPILFLSIIIASTGFLDDIGGSKKYQGYRGHFGSLLHGEVTTGVLKAIVTLLTATLVLFAEKGFYYWLFIDASIVVLMTNLINLFDLRPGRAVKFVLLLFIPLLFVKNYIYLTAFIVIMLYLYFDLKGFVMLGDTGANMLGVITGYFYIKNIPSQIRITLFLVLILLNYLSEKMSFSNIIKKNRLLNWFDMLGRK